MLRQFQQALVEQGRTDEAVIVGTRFSNAKSLQFAWRRKVQDAFGPKAAAGIYLTDQSFGLSMGYLRHIHDLTPLVGLPLSFLWCNDTGVTDLSPLRGMELNALDVSGCRIRDLAPLERLPLAKFWGARTEITDLAPLRFARLVDVDIHQTKVRDLSALRGMPVQRLIIDNTLVQDLSPLHGALLKELHLNSTQVRDLEPLRGAPLKTLVARNVTNFEPLRGMRLERVEVEGAADLSPLTGMALEAFHTGNSNVSDLSALAGMRLQRFSLYRAPKAADIRVLKGMPLVVVSLRGCPVRNLSPIHDAPLKEFVLGEPAYVYQPAQEPDLAFLRGKKLRRLMLVGLSGFEGSLVDQMPLEEFRASNCRLTSLEFLKGRPTQSAAEFWKEFDAKNKPSEKR